MFWGSSKRRKDVYPSESESSDVTDSETCWGRSSAKTEKRSKKTSHRRESPKSSPWFGAWFGSNNKPSPRKRKKKDRKQKNQGKFSKAPTGKRIGMGLLGLIVCLYYLNFFKMLYVDRLQNFQGVTHKTTLTTSSKPVSADQVASSPGTAPPTTLERELKDTAGSTVTENDSGSDQNRATADEETPQTGSSGTGSAMDQSQNTSTTGVQISEELPKHPMNRNMEELQVSPNSGTLSEDKVKEAYRKLAKAYLSTFAGGIHRQMYFDILRRRTYALTPPGANKGVQTILFQIIDKRVYMMDPYEVPRNSKPFYRTRINQVIWLLSKLCSENRIRNTEFLMAIHDCVQTVNKQHGYRGAHFQETNPAFTIVSCNFSDNVPFPMWEGAKHRDGGFSGWDETARRYAEDDVPWTQKQDRAVFRGGNRPSMYFKNKTDADLHCHDVGRTRLLYLSQQQPDVLDVSLGGTCGGVRTALQRMDAKDYHNFKYVLYAEGNCMWADRSKQQLFGPSAIIKQETPCGQFFEPLLTRNVHYIPTDFFFTDTVDKISWARQHDDAVRDMVKNANGFARNFLSLKGVETYVEVLLEEYTALLVEPDIKLENGAIDVTDKEV